MGLNFEWDPKKAESNFRKHQVSFVEASTVFADPLACIEDDPDHSQTEARVLILGASTRLRILVVAYTERDEKIRIISARRATKLERKQYEERSHR